MLLGALAALLLTGCLAPGGSGGGEPDCRQASNACAEGFTCVPLGSGASYGCRAVCAIDDDCPADQLCRDGVCAHQPPSSAFDAQVSPEPEPIAEPADAAPADVAIRVIDAAPPTPDVGPPDQGPPPSDVCAERAMIGGTYMVWLPLTIAPEFPLRYRAEVVIDTGSWLMDIGLQPLRREGRQVVDRVAPLVVEGVPIGADGTFVAGLDGLQSPSESNALGGDLVLDLVLRGALRPGRALCGALTGEVVEPQTLSVDGSIFAFGPWQAPVEDDPLTACAGCLPD